MIKEILGYTLRKIKKILKVIKDYENKRNLNQKLMELYSKNGKITVIRGPFAGMRYPDFVSTGSSLWPKLAGMYEKELQDVIEDVANKKYKYVIDIGCAEGYYAVGLAMKGVGERYIAYDNNPKAQELCTKMMEANGVCIEIKEFCDDKELNSYDFNKSELPSLILCDCEGYERDLFVDGDVNDLSKVELLIEIHDWLQDKVPTLDLIKDKFAESHIMEIIYGVDDYEKAYRYVVPELDGFSLREKKDILAEGRRRNGVWLHMMPR